LFSTCKKYAGSFLSYATDIVCEQYGTDPFEQDIGKQIKR